MGDQNHGRNSCARDQTFGRTIRKLADATNDSIQRLTDVMDRQAATMDEFKETMDGIKTLITTLNSKYEQIHEKSYKTMRVKGVIKKLQSMYSLLLEALTTFLDLGIAKRAGVCIQHTNPLTIVVADGTKIYSKALVKELQWALQGMNFSFEVRLLPLGGCDMVLGVQWLSTLGPVLWDIKNLQMQLAGKELILTGNTTTDFQIVDAKKMQHLLNNKSSGMLVQSCTLQAETS
ncbi:hypothetical protein RHSIM_Rhsim01G0083200 [Rhododendron simsii]|uniref:Uncharacterized protein n=1 Tax=Rhododendron simsii TaxID=118357 RepID=A0A834LYS0_RHOSS|nr:hypothetical protein RHSIM_Rhsim01G0083200 [Rhododendron simsii]